MAGTAVFSKVARAGPIASTSLTASLRALSIAAPGTKAPIRHTTITQTRSLSQSILGSATRRTCLTTAIITTTHTCSKHGASLRPALAAGSAKAVQLQQQTRGMKLRSAITKRCEHCKVVRRKRGKRHRGYLYVICSANPRHKQRQS